MLASFKSSAHYFFDWNLERIERCLKELTEDQLWARPNANSNSIGNQLLHLEGNIRQWIVAGLGKQEDVRVRDAEFAAVNGPTADILLDQLSTVIQEAKTIISSLSPEEMTQERPVQAYVHDATFIVMHVVEHLSYHTGQIIYQTKALRDLDLDFYGDVDLNEKG
ncbi:DinB family protein [Neolewinella agarilytica]|uniref:Uncharacterized damage-inducible protein DinB (Forms a four-helix bundle) n=1 Tax=Neolewinella agarilytica TaxID=478744 RepID=A0A1H9K0G2_9BACT|nr:DinB family protein [Neolewinella agarilytica]SEQ92589.1 Uncharacterized damage-inducible protein DinB (forms a four-helix bundle) [Neolewinella agarilytica]